MRSSLTFETKGPRSPIEKSLFVALAQPGGGGVVPRPRRGNSGVRWGRNGGPGLLTRAGRGRGTWRRRSEARTRPDPAESRGAGSGGGQDPGQVGDSGGEIELGGGLVTPEVPGLAQTQLHQPGQAVLHGLAEVAIGCESRTVLERAGGLQQGFLRVQTDLAPAATQRGRSGQAVQRAASKWKERRGARSPVAVVRSPAAARYASPDPPDKYRYAPSGQSGNPPWGSGSGPAVSALWRSGRARRRQTAGGCGHPHRPHRRWFL